MLQKDKIVIYYKCLKKTPKKGGDKMDKKKLKSLMVLNNDTGKTLSQYLGISEQTFSMKLNEKHGRSFTKDEVEAISNKYSLTPQEMVSIFFKHIVSKKDTFQI